MILLVLLYAVVPLVLPFNVLIWNPTVGHSHVRFLSNIADILINDGHNVTIVSPLIDPDVSVNGLNPAVLHLPYQSKYTKNIEDNDFAKLDIKGTSLWDAPTMEGRSTSVQDIALFMTTLKNVYRGLLEDKEFLSRLRDSRFDVALHEIYDCYPVAIFELIGVTKTVAVSAFGMTPYASEITGIPANPSYVPGVYSTYSDDMTFWERLNNFKFETEMNCTTWCRAGLLGSHAYAEVLLE